MPARLFLFPKDLISIEQIGQATAYKRYNDLRFLLNKPLKSKITIREYCDFNGLQHQDIVKIL